MTDSNRLDGQAAIVTGAVQAGYFAGVAIMSLTGISLRNASLEDQAFREGS